MTMTKTLISSAGLVAALSTLGAAAYKVPDLLPVTAERFRPIEMAVNELQSRTDALQTQVNLAKFQWLLEQQKLRPLSLTEQRELCILTEQLRFPASAVPGC